MAWVKDEGWRKQCRDGKPVTSYRLELDLGSGPYFIVAMYENWNDETDAKWNVWAFHPGNSCLVDTEAECRPKALAMLAEFSAKLAGTIRQVTPDAHASGGDEG